jgi:hypothetical protein
MSETSRGHDGVPRFLIGSLAVLCLTLPALVRSDERPAEKGDAAKVATKMENAKGAARQAEEERDALRHFQEDVTEYAELHAKQLATLQNRESVAAQKSLARAMKAKRSRAERGDIFRPEVQPIFRRLLAEQLEGPDARDARQSVIEGNPGDEKGTVPVVVRVNAEYPVGAARSTVPPSVLLTLPQLPESLHYRFAGRDLLLVDSVAQLIVDFLPAAAPAPVPAPAPALAPEGQ